MSIKNLSKELQSYVLSWCMKEKRCPLDSVCTDLVTKDCAIVRFLNDLNKDEHYLTQLLKETNAPSWSWQTDI